MKGATGTGLFIAMIFDQHGNSPSDLNKGILETGKTVSSNWNGDIHCIKQKRTRSRRSIYYDEQRRTDIILT